jgi:hypothetical protein
VRLPSTQTAHGRLLMPRSGIVRYVPLCDASSAGLAHQQRTDL